jgi:hypothetical protein
VFENYLKCKISSENAPILRCIEQARLSESSFQTGPRKIAKKKRGGRPPGPERPVSNSSGGPGPVITKAKDNGFKIIFGDHNNDDLFVCLPIFCGIL